MGVQLVVIEGRPIGAIIELKPGRLMIGRDPNCQLRPRSPTVSQFHCSLTRQGDEVTVVDLGSSNGTLVNNQFLHPGEAIKLVDGDRLQVGQLIFAFRTSGVPRGGGPNHDTWATHMHSGSDNDPSGQTLLVSALAEPGRESSHTPPEHAAEPSGFAYRELDDATGATCLGLSWFQVGDEARIRAMRKGMAEVISRTRSRRVVIDLGEVDALPSMAIATLVAMAMRCRVAGGGLRLCGLRPSVKRIISALKLGEMAPVYSNRDEALNDPWE